MGYIDPQSGAIMKPKLAVAGLILVSIVPASAKQKSVPCKSYFIMAENDAYTVNLVMSGLNKQQENWYNKRGEYRDICHVSADASRKRIPLTEKDIPDPTYMFSVVGTAPLYAIMWEEHIEYNSGILKYNSANGTLNKWDVAKQDWVPVVPIHDTSRTRLSSPSVSLLKAALRKISQQ
jgi:hypothetical protein